MRSASSLGCTEEQRRRAGAWSETERLVHSCESHLWGRQRVPEQVG